MKAGLKLNLPSQATIPQPPTRTSTSVVPQASPQPPRRPPPPNPSTNQPRQQSPNPIPPQQHAATSSQSTYGLLSSLKGGAGSLFKNLKVGWISILKKRTFKIKS